PAFATRRSSDLEGLHSLEDGLGLGLVVHDRVVERAVGLDVGDLRAAGTGQCVESADLVEHLVGELGGGVVDEATAEAGLVAVTDVGSDGHAALSGGLEGLGDIVRVAGVGAAGGSRGGDAAGRGGGVPHRVAGV